jgi:hypothetical protein
MRKTALVFFPIFALVAVSCASLVHGAPAEKRIGPATSPRMGRAVAPPAAEPLPKARPLVVPPALQQSQLRVTLGEVKPAAGARLSIRAAKVRFVAPSTVPTARVAFTYIGPTSQTAPLASGVVRRQVGLKLRALNGCNLVYAMWRFEPVNELVVSVKHNPGKTTHAECGVSGYSDIAAVTSVKPPQVTAGSKHTLDAQLTGEKLRVLADATLVWEGTLPKMNFDGPSGLRTDNASIDFDYAAQAAPLSAVSSALPGLSFLASED